MTTPRSIGTAGCWLQHYFRPLAIAATALNLAALLAINGQDDTYLERAVLGALLVLAVLVLRDGYQADKHRRVNKAGKQLVIDLTQVYADLERLTAELDTTITELTKRSEALHRYVSDHRDSEPRTRPLPDTAVLQHALGHHRFGPRS